MGTKEFNNSASCHVAHMLMVVFSLMMLFSEGDVARKESLLDGVTESDKVCAWLIRINFLNQIGLLLPHIHLHACLMCCCDILPCCYHLMLLQFPFS